MKTLSLLLLLALPAAAAEDCAKNADACAGGKKAASPFTAASLSEMKPAPAKKAPELKPAPEKKAPEPKPATEKRLPDQAPAAEAAAAPAAPEAGTAPVPPPAQRRELSSPLWLLFVGGALAGLYFYLRGSARKGGRK